MIDLILLDGIICVWFSNLENVCVLFDSSLNASLLLIQFPQEPISKLNHDIGKTKEEIRFKVLVVDHSIVATEVLLVEAVIYDGEDLVHALDVFDSGVELGIYEENAMENICTCLDVIFDIFRL